MLTIYTVDSVVYDPPRPNHKNDDAIDSAINDARGVQNLVDALNKVTHIPVTRTMVYYWRRTAIPAERAVELEKALSGRVARGDLRPDLFNCGFSDV